MFASAQAQASDGRRVRRRVTGVVALDAVRDRERRPLFDHDDLAAEPNLLGTTCDVAEKKIPIPSECK